ncbi:ABC transporter permease [Inconstantimicrobium mannanitabidum]|uniref:Permease n=1 Tax=Inconstantimicrobium mannanitabidum TaxID=1604901 RepID=A0ACB5RD05_9CLOT|nr:ABC transporter permease [Clostridium sp. TW13]GKX67155.1 permease [Clostridium sp. TW13]
MLRMIKGILYRMINNKVYLVVPIILTPIMIFAAIYFSNNLSIKGNIAVVGMDNVNLAIKEVKVTKLKTVPQLSELVQNKYDGVVIYKNGKFKVDTVKGNEFKENIEACINGKTPNWDREAKRGVAANIIGYITMFVLFLGMMLYRFYYEEKGGISKRILSGSISYVQYATAHVISVFLMIFVPTTGITLITKEVLNINTKVSSLEVAFILFVLCLFASAFGFLISSIIKEDENATLVGSMTILVTTLLSGSFFSVTKNGFIDKISNLFPQKYLLDFTISLENNNSANYMKMGVVLVITATILTLGIFIGSRKLKGNNC